MIIKSLLDFKFLFFSLVLIYKIQYSDWRRDNNRFPFHFCMEPKNCSNLVVIKLQFLGSMQKWNGWVPCKSETDGFHAKVKRKPIIVYKVSACPSVNQSIVFCKTKLKNRNLKSRSDLMIIFSGIRNRIEILTNDYFGVSQIFVRSKIQKYIFYHRVWGIPVNISIRRIMLNFLRCNSLKWHCERVSNRYDDHTSFI